MASWFVSLYSFKRTDNGLTVSAVKIIVSSSSSSLLLTLIPSLKKAFDNIFVLVIDLYIS
jgi:hypothetical protein